MFKKNWLSEVSKRAMAKTGTPDHILAQNGYLLKTSVQGTSQTTRLAQVGCQLSLAKSAAVTPHYGHSAWISTFLGQNSANQRPRMSLLRFTMPPTHKRGRWARGYFKGPRHDGSTCYTRPYCDFIALHTTYICTLHKKSQAFRSRARNRYCPAPQ